MLYCVGLRRETLVGKSIGLGEKLNRGIAAKPKRDLFEKMPGVLRSGGNHQHRKAELMVKTGHEIRPG